ncbi:MAG TPA: YceI family protein [Usitatibacter sp.]|jgi:polyisoprenoid-binding protein YceI|nr:YceI family protein [Usitatibacter sp.]
MTRFSIAAGLATFAALGASAEPLTYNIDPSHTFPQYEINHMGFSLQRGRFDKTQGTIVLDLDTHKGTVEVDIETASIDSGEPKLDQHLKGEDFFDVKKFPQMTFKSSDLAFEGEVLKKASGELTIKGVTKPVTFDVDYFKCGNSLVLLRKVCGADLSARIKRSDFGVSYGIPLVGDDVRLRVNVEALGPR